MDIVQEYTELKEKLEGLEVQQLVETAMRMQFPGIQIYDAVKNNNGNITFKIGGGDYSEDEIEQFLNDIKKKTAYA
jgi:hypothetical protein